ncbi:molybdopterin-dependent oxidoreductase [Haloarchaeobius sp. DFWS5]|uniref:molybdopterin-dependent oxidoreductase n=1 Tax=Haloarchaeobius sp. DFWS5 TaxID=3446114 RepID=UPI003EBA4604
MTLRTSTNRTDAVLAVLAGVAAVAGSYAVAGWSRERFAVAPVDALVVNNTPDVIVRYSIQWLGSAGHILHIALALALTVVALGLPTLGALVLGRRLGQPLVGAALTAGAVGGLLLAVTGSLTSSAIGGLSAGAVVAIGTLEAGPLGGFGRPDVASSASDEPTPEPGRRRLISLFLGTAVFASIGAVLGSNASKDADPEPTPLSSANDTEQLLADAERQSFTVEGLGGLITPIGEFYETDINAFDPETTSGDFSLSVTGAVDQEVSLNYDQLTEMEPEHRFITLRCVGEHLNGHKMDTALWTGVPVKSLLDEAGPSSDCGCVMAHAADGYFVQFPLSALEDAFLAYGMNGMSLPRKHGRPVRLLVPGHWGEVNVKWITELELLEEAADGYWEKRGWHGTGPVNTVAKLHATNRLDDGRVQVAGHAYAGTRGVDRVEVSTDGGETWTDAELSMALPGTDVWRMWKYEFTPEGEHEVVVRATDGTGTLQPEEEAESFPSGASGWVRKTVQG